MGGSYINKLIDHEEMLAKLYTAFASAFPGEKKFWESIVKEEMHHKCILESLEEKVKSGEWVFKKPVYLYGYITDSIEWISRLINRIENSGMTLQEALHTALTAEKGIIETKYMDFVSEDNNPDARMVLNAIKEETSDHIKKIEDKANSMKWRFFGKTKRTASTHTVIESTDSMEAAKQAQRDILQCLVALEENASMLYTIYQNKFPDYADFWTKYAAEEMQHASMIKSLFNYLEKGHLFKKIGAFDKEQLIKEIEFIMDTQNKARQSEITMDDAVNTALKLEIMLSESSFYKEVESSAPEYQHVCQRMMELLEKHKQKLHEKLMSLRKQ